MRIAFVGKGGSGKTTISVLFAQYIAKKGDNLLIFDADINMHIKDSLGFKKIIPSNKFLSHFDATKKIKKYLIGKRRDIKDLNTFRKTTPPSNKSSLLNFEKINKSILNKFIFNIGKIKFSVLGTYEEKDIGKSCYHNNLSILENILSHFEDQKGFIITDMVAGVDSFANTLHSQFDVICIVVEPTKRSLDVYKHFKKLGMKSNIYKNIFVIGNKISSKNDEKFISKNIAKEKIIGYIKNSKHITETEQKNQKINLNKLSKDNIKTLEKLRKVTIHNQENPNLRLHRIWNLHKKYTSQKNITSRFGDLKKQIDKSFSFTNNE